MRSKAVFFAPLSLLVAIAACSSNTTIINHVAAEDGGVDDEDSGVVATGDAGTTGKDAGAKKDAGVSAPNPQPIPPVAYNGGGLILSPQLVSVTFDSDTLRTTIESFDDSIGTTPWWDAVRAGFCDKNNKCIGQATNGGHVHLATNTLQANYTDSTDPNQSSSIQTMISNLITAKTLPAPTANTLYMIYFPSGVNISLDGAGSCQAFGGYHNSMTFNATEFAYAIMPRCQTGGGAQADLDQLTNAASHELAEAATDPFIDLNSPSLYTGYGSSVDAWDAPAGGEVGDRCFDIFGSGNDQYQQGSYQVQRIFNNTAAAKGHDPCVPAPNPSTTPYFNIAPLSSTGDVIGLTVGDTANVTVQGISDGPISGQLAWDVVELTQTLGKGTDGTVTFSGGGGLAVGQKATISFKAVSAPAKPNVGQAIFAIRSQRTDSSGKTTGALHYWPFVVQTQQP